MGGTAILVENDSNGRKITVQIPKQSQSLAAGVG
jgi:hypothetical protein